MHQYTLTLPSPAKLNLFLHITRRRHNGYHDLQTLFQLINYGDTLRFECRDDSQLQLKCNQTALCTPDNLVLQAAQALQHHSNISLGANIHLDKRLPMGGGIGGGSSNAATALLGLNHLWNLQLSIGALADIGLALGADVPVFVQGQSAWAEGVGDTLTPMNIPQQWYLVIKPPCHVSTAEIFSHEELTRDTAAITVAAFFEQGGKNDCERVVCQTYPEVNEALQWLKQHGKAQLTGTGACVFSSFASQRQAQTVLEQTPTEWECFIAEGINHSPLQHRLRELTS